MKLIKMMIVLLCVVFLNSAIFIAEEKYSRCLECEDLLCKDLSISDASDLLCVEEKIVRCQNKSMKMPDSWGYYMFRYQPNDCYELFVGENECKEGYIYSYSKDFILRQVTNVEVEAFNNWVHEESYFIYDNGIYVLDETGTQCKKYTKDQI